MSECPKPLLGGLGVGLETATEQTARNGADGKNQDNEEEVSVSSDGPAHAVLLDLGSGAASFEL
jgi:hypothetical protein